MASKEPSSPPLVVIDANLLYPFHLRNLLVQLGVDAVIAPRWTARIHAEWIGNLVAAGRAPEERLLLTRNLMNNVLPAAEVHGWETCMDGLTLPDPDDRHVLAAALGSWGWDDPDHEPARLSNLGVGTTRRRCGPSRQLPVRVTRRQPRVVASLDGSGARKSQQEHAVGSGLP